MEHIQTIYRNGNAATLASLDKRYTAHLNAYLYWLKTECHLQPAAIDSFKEKIASRIPGLKQDFQELQQTTTQENRSQLYLNNFPALFPHSHLGSTHLLEISNEQKKLLLTSSESSLLESRIQERSDRIKRAYCRHLVLLVDEQLYLTAWQHQELLASLQHLKSYRPIDLFGEYHHYEEHYLDKLRKAIPIPDSLSQTQQHAWQNLTRRTNSLYFQAPAAMANDLPQLSHGLIQNQTKWHEILSPLLTLQAEYVGASNKWTTKELYQGKLACEGSIQRTLHRNLDKLLIERKRHLDYHYFYWGAEGFGGPRWPMILEEKVWQTTITKLDKAHSLGARKQRMLDDECSYLTSMIEEELWLTPTQRDQFNTTIMPKLKQIIETRRADIPHDFDQDLQTLARVLLAIQHDEIIAILSEEQMPAWDQLRSFFVPVGDEIQVQTRYGLFGMWKLSPPVSPD